MNIFLNIIPNNIFNFLHQYFKKYNYNIYINKKKIGNVKLDIVFIDDLEDLDYNYNINTKIIFLLNNTSFVKPSDKLEKVFIILPFNDIIYEKYYNLWIKYRNKLCISLSNFKKDHEFADLIKNITKPHKINKNNLLFIRSITSNDNKFTKERDYIKQNFILTKKLPSYKNIAGQARYDNYCSLVKGFINIGFVDHVDYVIVGTKSFIKLNPNVAYYCNISDVLKSFTSDY